MAPLIQSLRHPMVARDRWLQEALDLPGKPFAEALAEALRTEGLAGQPTARRIIARMSHRICPSTSATFTLSRRRRRYKASPRTRSKKRLATVKGDLLKRKLGVAPARPREQRFQPTCLPRDAPTRKMRQTVDVESIQVGAEGAVVGKV